MLDHETVDASEEFARVARMRTLIRRRKQCANKIVERQLDVRVAGRQQRFITFICALNKIEQRASGARSPGPACSPQRFESKMRDKRPPRQIEYQPLRDAIIHEACHRPGGIDQHDIVRGDLSDSVVLGKRCTPGYLKKKAVVLRAIEPDVSLCPLDPGGRCIRDLLRLVRARLAGATNRQTQRARCLPDCTDHSSSKGDLSTHHKAVAARRKNHGTVALPSPIQTCPVQSMFDTLGALAYCRYGFDNRGITIGSSRTF